jgi:2-polyprenyl-6-methoxyphenol hydroxylase-like FAD-dependent oxidoreductase
MQNYHTNGDAAHPMSPFKGQGANQALLDALALTRAITQGSQEVLHWKKKVRKSILANFDRNDQTDCGKSKRFSYRSSISSY